MRDESVTVKCRKSGGSAILVTSQDCIGKKYKRKIWKNGSIMYTEVEL